MLSNVFLWVIPLLKRDINVIIPFSELFYLDGGYSQPYFSSTQTSLQGESPSEEKFSMIALYVSLPLCQSMTNHQCEAESLRRHTLLSFLILPHILCNMDKTSRKSGSLSIPFHVHFPTIGNVKTSRAASTVPQPSQDLRI
jgi:hypothetical protein